MTAAVSPRSLPQSSTGQSVTEIRRRKYQPLIAESLHLHANGNGNGNGNGHWSAKPRANRDDAAPLAGLPNVVSGSLKTAYHDLYDGERILRRVIHIANPH